MNDSLSVATVQSTPNPEKLVCICARGDYYDGFVGDASFEEIIENATYTMDDVEFVDEHPEMFDRIGGTIETKARVYHLLEFLFTREHWGAFEHPSITMAVGNASRACMGQITRHRHITFDVQSQRYVDFSDTPVRELIKTPESLRDPDNFNREQGANDIDDEDREFLRGMFEKDTEQSVQNYNQFVERGVPKEDARFVLPIGSTVNWTMSLNPRALLHIANIRGKADAQWEARELSDLVLDEFEEWMPITSYLWDQHGPYPLSP